MNVSRDSPCARMKLPLGPCSSRGVVDLAVFSPTLVKKRQPVISRPLTSRRILLRNLCCLQSCSKASKTYSSRLHIKASELQISSSAKTVFKPSDAGKKACNPAAVAGQSQGRGSTCQRSGVLLVDALVEVAYMPFSRAVKMSTACFRQSNSNALHFHGTIQIILRIAGPR